MAKRDGCPSRLTGPEFLKPLPEAKRLKEEIELVEGREAAASGCARTSNTAVSLLGQVPKRRQARRPQAITKSLKGRNELRGDTTGLLRSEPALANLAQGGVIDQRRTRSFKTFKRTWCRGLGVPHSRIGECSFANSVQESTGPPRMGLTSRLPHAQPPTGLARTAYVEQP